MPISKERMPKYVYKAEDLEPLGLVVPQYLKSVVSNAPKGDRKIGQYLQRLVADGEITTDDVTFLIESGALQN